MQLKTNDDSSAEDQVLCKPLEWSADEEKEASVPPRSRSPADVVLAKMLVEMQQQQPVAPVVTQQTVDEPLNLSISGSSGPSSSP